MFGFVFKYIQYKTCKIDLNCILTQPNCHGKQFIGNDSGNDFNILRMKQSERDVDKGRAR